MKAHEVAKLLQQMGLPSEMTPYGFTISEKWRLESGSGIAGRTDFWRLLYIPTGRSFTEHGGYRLKGQLKAALKAWSDWHRNIEALAKPAQGSEKK